MKSDNGSAGQSVRRVSRGAVWMPLLAILASGAVWAGITEWTNVGPEGGGARFLAIDPQTPSTVYAGTGVGVFKSKDGGTSWSNSGLNGFVVSGLVMDPRNPTTLYALTQDQDYSAAQVFKTTDGGASWNEAGFCCINLVIDPQGTGTQYVLAG